MLALLAESVLLVGLVMLAGEHSGRQPGLRDAAAALVDSPDRDLILALLVAGFGTKAGLVPLHVWMPLAHAAAPMPASAVLSGAVVKVGIIGLIRFLPLSEALPDWGVGAHGGRLRSPRSTRSRSASRSAIRRRCSPTRA